MNVLQILICINEGVHLLLNQHIRTIQVYNVNLNKFCVYNCNFADKSILVIYHRLYIQ